MLAAAHHGLFISMDKWQKLLKMSHGSHHSFHSFLDALMSGNQMVFQEHFFLL